jgi:dTDP-4-amino-4,6-dideoxygalactose transaminase
MVLKKSPPPVSIPLNCPALVGSELRYIGDALRRGQISGDGYYTRLASASLEHLLGVPRVLLTPSCTHALELAFLLLPTKPGQEVLCPSFTFPSTANAFVLRGLKPRFIDIRPDTLNIDECLLERAVTRRTVAIAPVHYAGVPCQMDVIMRVAHKHGLAVIEDAAQALGARFKGRMAGTFGVMSAFSFHETKNCNCGEGGCLVMRGSRFIRRAEIIRQKGTNREQYFRGEVAKYSWVDIGSSYIPSELQSAYLQGQLEHLGEITRKRRELHERYVEALAPLAARGCLRLPCIPGDRTSAYHLFYILLENAAQSRRVRLHLQSRGILSAFHYFPLHLSTMGKRFGYRAGDFPVTESMSKRLLRLPFYSTMTWREQKIIFQALRDAF